MALYTFLMQTSFALLLFQWGWLSVRSVAILEGLTYTLEFFVLYYFWRRSIKEMEYKPLPMFQGAFKNWTEHFELGLPSAVMTGCEFWIYEAMAIFAGFLGVVPLGTIVIVNSMCSAFYEIGTGLSLAISSMIGRLLGAENVNEAKKVAALGI